MPLYDASGALHVTNAAPVLQHPTVLATYKATADSPGVTTGQYIQLRQIAPNPPEWFNIDTKAVLATSPSAIEPIGGVLGYGVIQWRALNSNSGLGYSKNDYLKEIVNASTGSSRWYNGNTELTGPPPLTDREIPGGGIGIPVSGFGVIYNIVGSTTLLQGVWDIANSRVYPQDGGTAISIGVAPNNATNLQLIGATERRSQDWIVVPFAGDPGSGLAQRSIAREFTVLDVDGVPINTFWTNANGLPITSPSRSNLVRAEGGYPQPIPIEYALNNNPNVFLSGYAVPLPGGGVDLYSDYGLTAHIVQGNGATEAIALSSRPQTAENPATTPNPRFFVFTAINTEQTISLAGCKGIEIINQSGRELRYGWAAGQCVTPVGPIIGASEFKTSISDIYYTGMFCLAAADVPDSLTVTNAIVNAGSSSVGGVFTNAEQGQLISGAGIPNNTYIRSLDKAKLFATLCDSTGAIVVATVSSTTAQLTVSGAVVRLTHWV
jgi:hypothetical protein